jgi:hypothetical protein
VVGIAVAGGYGPARDFDQKAFPDVSAPRPPQRLECSGLWRDAPGAQRREVQVRLGEATLILSDPRSAGALSHWSLPAVERRNPGLMPAVYAPGPDAPETLELADRDMVAALDGLRGAILARTPKPGRLRGWLLGGTVLAILGAAAFWLPGALLDHTARVLPDAKRAEIGQAALDDLVTLTGPPCNRPEGLTALAALSERLFGPRATPILYIVPDGLSQSVHLPGDLFVLSDQWLTDAEGPEALAGAVLAEAERAAGADPTRRVLDHLGPMAAFRLLTSGEMPVDGLSGYGDRLVGEPPNAVETGRLLQRSAEAGVPMAAYAARAFADAEAARLLSDADPLRGSATEALMSDEAWLALQAICEPAASSGG